MQRLYECGHLYFNAQAVAGLKLNLRKFKWKTLSEVLRSGVWNSVQSLSDLMISGLNSLLTNRFIGTAAGGYLQSSKTIPNYILQLGQQLAQVFSPKFTILYAQGDYDRLVKEAKRSMRLVGFIISTPVAGFIVFGYQFYALWLKNYSPGGIADRTDCVRYYHHTVPV